jgi:hypothetical protein
MLGGMSAAPLPAHPEGWCGFQEWSLAPFSEPERLGSGQQSAARSFSGRAAVDVQQEGVCAGPQFGPMNGTF